MSILITETGAVVEGANSYASAAELVTWAGNRGLTIPSTEAEQEALLLKAMDYLERYNEQWRGVRVSAAQFLAWPRSGVYVDYQLRASDEIPRELFYAQLQLAVSANSVDLQPVQAANAPGPVTEKTVQGAVTLRYASPGRIMPVAADAKADALIRVLLNRSGLELRRA